MDGKKVRRLRVNGLKLCFCLLVCLPLMNQAFAQSTDTSELVPMTRMVMRQWTGDDGLISNNLTSVKQTSDGFIWVTSFNGVHRFDGHSFKLYDKENIPSLKTNAFYSVTENNLGEVLLASQGSGILKYANGSIEKLDSINVSSVRKVLTDRSGRLWCGTNNEGVVLIDQQKVEKVSFEAFNQVIIFDIYEDSNNDIWFGTGGNGLVKYSKGDLRVFNTNNILKDNTVTTIIESSDGELILGSPSGLYIIDAENETTTLVPKFNNIEVNGLLEGKNNMLWVASEQGLIRTNLKSGYFEMFNEKLGLPGNQVSSVALDHEGSLWLSTKKAGLIRMNLGSITSFGKSDGLSSSRINIVFENDEKLFIGSDDGAIFIKEGDKVSPLNLLPKDNEVGIRDFVVDDDGTLWVASYMGLLGYNGGQQELITTKDGLSSNLIRKILKTKDGKLWLATRSGGVIKFEGKNKMEAFNVENQLRSNYVLALQEDNHGNIIVGTHSGGLSIIEKDTVTTYFIPEISGALIFNIYVDKDNRYWLSTNTGIFAFDNYTFKKIEFNTGFKVETIFDFVPDNEGNVWLTTNIGIGRIVFDDLDEFLKGNVEMVDVELFDNHDGMANKECTGATRSLLTSWGEIWVPTIEGIAIINNDKIQKNLQVPNIIITSLIVDKEPLPLTTRNIKSGKVRYEIDYASASYLVPEKVRFRYKLSGVDKDWITTNKRSVEYTNLAPGNYTFSVIGSNGNDVWNEKGDNISFVVEPFYYQTWWFYVIVAIVLSLTIYFIFVWRVNRLKIANQQLSKLNTELDRFVYSASHDLRAPLASILGLVNLAKASRSFETIDECFDLIQKSVGKLDDFIKDIIDYSRNQRTEVSVKEIEIEKELREIVEGLKFLDDEGKIICTIKSSISTFKTDLMRLSVVVRNITANAFLYHDESKPDQFINLTCEENGGEVKISIVDNGLGMKKSDSDQIFKMFYRGHEDSQGSGLGLYIAKENIDKLGGKIEVASELGKGTTFTISIPKM